MLIRANIYKIPKDAQVSYGSENCTHYCRVSFMIRSNVKELDKLHKAMQHLLHSAQLVTLDTSDREYVLDAYDVMQSRDYVQVSLSFRSAYENLSRNF